MLAYRARKKVHFPTVQQDLRTGAALPLITTPRARARCLVARAPHAVPGAHIARGPHEVINVAVQTWQLSICAGEMTSEISCDSVVDGRSSADTTSTVVTCPETFSARQPLCGRRRSLLPAP